MALDVLSDMITNSLIDPDELESERKVILEEIAMHEDAPDELVHDLFYRSMWDGHPLGRPVLGFNSDDRCGVTGIRSPSTGASGTRRRTSWSPAPGTSITTPSSSRSRRDLRRAVREAHASRRRSAEAEPGCRRSQTSDRAGAHRRSACRRPATRPRGQARAGVAGHGSRRRDVVAALPGDPREAGPRLRRVLVPVAVRRHRHVRDLRRERRRRTRTT